MYNMWFGGNVSDIRRVTTFEDGSETNRRRCAALIATGRAPVIVHVGAICHSLSFGPCCCASARHDLPISCPERCEWKCCPWVANEHSRSSDEWVGLPPLAIVSRKGNRRKSSRTVLYEVVTGKHGTARKGEDLFDRNSDRRRDSGGVCERRDGKPVNGLHQTRRRKPVKLCQRERSWLVESAARGSTFTSEVYRETLKKPENSHSATNVKIKLLNYNARPHIARRRPQDVSRQFKTERFRLSTCTARNWLRLISVRLLTRRSGLGPITSMTTTILKML